MWWKPRLLKRQKNLLTSSDERKVNMAGRIKHQVRSRKTHNKGTAGKRQFYYLTQVKTQKFGIATILQDILMKKER